MKTLSELLENIIVVICVCLGLVLIVSLVIISYIFYFPIKLVKHIIHKIKGE